MSKRSVAVAEAETRLSGAVGAFGGLGDERGTKVLADLMQDCEAADARELVLKVVLATTDQHLLRLCISLGTIEKLGQWVQQHSSKPGREDKQLLHTLLSCLNKMNTLMSLAQKSQTCRIVGDLCHHTDPSISSKATAIVTLWKNQSPTNDLLKPNQTVKSRWSGNSVGNLKQCAQRKLRYGVVVLRISLSNVDGRKKTRSKLSSFSTGPTNQRLNALPSVPPKNLTSKPKSSVSTTFASETISYRRKQRLSHTPLCAVMET